MSVQRMPELSAANLGKPVTSKSENTRNRILDAAIEAFAGNEVDSVSIVDIASRAGITSQGIYRYFPNKYELFLAAVEKDYSELFDSVITRLTLHPAPFLSGEIWRQILLEAPEHPLAVKEVAGRDPQVLDRVNNSEHALTLIEALKCEIAHAISEKFLRQDLDPIIQAEATGFIMLNISIPMAFAGKFNSPEWFAMAGTQLAAWFYPLPNFQDPSVAKVFEEKIISLGPNAVLKNYKNRNM
ncbi:TetR/AcrR family transcriptional regulator [Aurantimicrobium minutum]|uniref:TetR/AcrR family transcriptional regulator n=1 Tax=Aurantimicrobium minutum TaxID=708131 RepID=UPI002474B50A|nr:TetR/AcrR family transcriptional regulator [Aurantimicrobium minutum]MDH6423518.1 AcrR family transcriptional regulator [Aurantimicrobium minutum]